MNEREPFEHEGTNTRRLDRVETDVAALTSGFADLRGDVRAVSEVLRRIEGNITSRDGQAERERLAKQPNALAMAATLFTIIASLVGGAWATSGQLARLDERTQLEQKRLDRLEQQAWSEK